MVALMRPRTLLAPLIVISLLAAGCFGATNEPLDPAEDATEGGDGERVAQSLPPTPDPAPANTTSGTAPSTPTSGATSPEPPSEAAERFAVSLKSDGTLGVTVPVPVVLMGFPKSTADALAAKLDPRKVDHDAYNTQNLLMPGSAGGTTPLPIVTTADYRVYHADNDTYAQLLALSEGDANLGGALRDANKIEDWLAARLAPDPTAPTIVLLAMPSERTYQYTLPGGALEGVRVFGERHPLLVVDVTASTDEWVGTSNAYDQPLNVGDAKIVDTLATLVAQATHHRILQGPLYPQATTECHAVTVLALERASSLGGSGLVARGADLLDTDTLAASFTALMGNTVHLDVKSLLLPVDDPALGALTTGGEQDALRTYLETNFEQYHVPHEGCEPYLSLVVDGDATDGTHGVAQFDATSGHRIAFSFVDDVQQLCAQPDFPICASDSDGSFDWFTFLVAHETGHLLGQRHPHDITGGDVARTMSFSSIWSPMSYQVGDKIAEFGAMDKNNQLRNRVAYLYAEKHADLDEAGTVALEDALSLHDWAAAEAALRGATLG